MRKSEALEALERNLTASAGLLKVAIDSLNLPSLPDDEILRALEAARKAPTDPALQLSARLEILARASIPTTVLASERLRLEVELATIDHEHSIHVSAANAQAHEALIGRSLEGLAAYHRGGVTPEEIANFIRAAQAVAVGVIGGRL